MSLLGKFPISRECLYLTVRRFEHYKMLEFCARHSIKPAIEMLDLNEESINTAFDRLQKNDVRYRFVLKHSE